MNRNGRDRLFHLLLVRLISKIIKQYNGFRKRYVRIISSIREIAFSPISRMDGIGMFMSIPLFLVNNVQHLQTCPQE